MKENFDEEKVDLRILKTRNVLYFRRTYEK